MALYLIMLITKIYKGHIIYRGDIVIDYFINLNYVYQALIATIFTWGVTALGAALVFFFKRVKKGIMDGMLGLAAGVMIAASFWSLLSPAIEMAESLNMISWAIVAVGFLSGGILLFIGDKIFNYIGDKQKENRGQSKVQVKSFKRCLMLIFSITLHNIPEGMAVGVAFGSLAYNLEGANLISACILALGIGLQNFPEGTAVSVPLRREGFSRTKSFIYGMLSGIVEPIAAVIGALLVVKIRLFLPFLLAFAAGAMIYVVVEELIPESQTNERKDVMALFTLIGFAIMMILDVALG